MWVRRRVSGQSGQSQRRLSFRQPDGDRLPPRPPPSPSPLDSALPLYFGVLNDAEVSHFVSVPDEVDLYSVTLQSGETLDASIDAQQAGSDLTSLLRVFNVSGT